MTSKKMYIKVAEIIKTANERYPSEVRAIREIRNGLAEYFNEDNPLFDMCKFLKACEV